MSGHAGYNLTGQIASDTHCQPTGYNLTHMIRDTHHRSADLPAMFLPIPILQTPVRTS